jgi:ABC-2 type transport system permease protein
VALVNHDDGEWGQRIDEVLGAVEAGPETWELTRLTDETEAIEGVRRGLFKAAIVVPRDLSRRLDAGTGPEVGIFVDNTDGISAGALQARFEAALGAVPRHFVPIRPDRTRIAPRTEDLYRSVDYDQTLVPGVVVMAIFMGTMITGVFNLVMDRFLGVDEAILMTPVTRLDIVVGLVVAGFLITMLMALVVLVLSVLITQLPVSFEPGRVLGVLLVLALTTLGLLSMMFLLLGRANHPRIVGVFSGFLNVIFFFPSGAVYPVESFPSWLRTFVRINPEYYAVHALKSILIKGTPISFVASDLLFLFAFTTLMLFFAVVTFRRTL